MMFPVDQTTRHMLEQFSTRTDGGVPAHNDLVVFCNAFWPVRVGGLFLG